MNTKVLVTGGGRGIGRAIALRFAREGADVAVAARSMDELGPVAAEIEALGTRGFAVRMDVCDPGSVAQAVEQAAEALGGLDVLVNNAGVFAMAPFGELEAATWDRHLAANLSGPFHVTRAALPHLERGERAHVFNVASTAARKAFPGNVAYCASKYGLRGFSDALRLDLAPAGIRVTTVYPGATDTTIFDDVPGDWDRSTMNQPDDVAEVLWGAFVAEPTIDDADVPPPVS